MSNRKAQYPEEILADEILERLKDRGLTVFDIIDALDAAKSIVQLTEFTGAPDINQRRP